MSHVDEGTLHAYLDGELPSSERAAVEAHLAQCAACRTMLDDERALLERASALLESARPVERPAPLFEQLRRSPRRSSWRVRTPVAWAASIMVALGLGYYLRDPGTNAAPTAALFRHEESPAGVAEDRAAPAATPAPVMGQAQPERRAQTRRRAEPRAAELAQADVQVRADSAAAVPPAGPVGAVALKSSPQLRNIAPTVGEAPAPAAKDSLALSAAIVASRAEAERARDVRATPRTLVTTQWQIISRGAAASLLGTDPVGLPGLATRRIRRSPAPDATVVVEQALDSSTVIQVFQRPASTDAFYIDGARLDSTAEAVPGQRERAAAPRAAAPARATERLARFVGGLRVEITGPLSTDSLNRLLEQVKPIEP